jgi:D-beta-D-heptose 7-phosphate kinase/D-beta-D-heptose 1-phosphate adenosyltransferase
MSKTPHIVVVGDVMVDRTFEVVSERLSSETGVPIYRLELQRATPGGAANVAANITSLGCIATLFGVVGCDDGARALKVFPRLVADPDRPTTVKARFYQHGSPLFRLDTECTTPIGSELVGTILERALDSLRAADALVISDYAKGVCTPELCRRLICAAHRHKLPVIIDPKGSDPRKYAGATVLTPNATELTQLGGLDVLYELADSVLVTAGGEGMTVCLAYGSPSWIPAESSNAVDVTGCGDTVVAALAIELARGQVLEAAALAASVAAGIAVEQAGTAAVAEKDWRAHMKASKETVLAQSTGMCV